MDATRERHDGLRPVRVPAGTATLEGDLGIPEGARGVVPFAHGSGSSRHSLALFHRPVQGSGMTHVGT
jgi:putative phosphoribosyl transferase